jgi:uncharacterized membrane protein YfcA
MLSFLPKSAKMVAKTSAIGFIAGFGGSLAGMGGGFVMIPLLTSTRIGVNLTQHGAHGSSLFAVAATGAAGALSYWDYVDLKAAAAIAVPAMFAARFGAKATSYFSENTLKMSLGWYMLMIAPSIPFKDTILSKTTTQTTLSSPSAETISAVATKDNFGSSSSGSEEQFQNQKAEVNYPLFGCVGLLSGGLSGLMGVGGGSVVVPAVALSTDFNHYQALSTSLAAMVLPAVVGSATHYQMGNIILGTVGVPLAVGSFAGAYVGGKSKLVVFVLLHLLLHLT